MNTISARPPVGGLAEKMVDCAVRPETFMHYFAGGSQIEADTILVDLWDVLVTDGPGDEAVKE